MSDYAGKERATAIERQRSLHNGQPKDVGQGEKKEGKREGRGRKEGETYETILIGGRRAVQNVRKQERKKASKQARDKERKKERKKE